MKLKEKVIFEIIYSDDRFTAVHITETEDGMPDSIVYRREVNYSFKGDKTSPQYYEIMTELECETLNEAIVLAMKDAADFAKSLNDEGSSEYIDEDMIQVNVQKAA